MDLSFAEQVAVEQIQAQSDGQLEYTIKELSNDAGYDFVEFLVVPQGKCAFPVAKKFFLDALLHELEFREGEPNE